LSPIHNFHRILLVNCITTALDYEEETEAVLKEFIKTELEIPDADQINFQNVHHLRKNYDGKPRNIIARFTH
jgi:hypothetical protein